MRVSEGMELTGCEHASVAEVPQPCIIHGYRLSAWRWHVARIRQNALRHIETPFVPTGTCPPSPVSCAIVLVHSLPPCLPRVRHSHFSSFSAQSYKASMLIRCLLAINTRIRYKRLYWFHMPAYSQVHRDTR